MKFILDTDEKYQYFILNELECSCLNLKKYFSK